MLTGPSSGFLRLTRNTITAMNGIATKADRAARVPLLELGATGLAPGVGGAMGVETGAATGA